MKLLPESPLLNEEIDELDQFLLNAEGIEESMDVSTLDGFLCAEIGRASCRGRV